MKMRNILTGVFCLLLITGGAAVAADSLTVVADYASYFLPADTTTYVEYYYGLYRHQLGFINSEENGYSYAGVLVTAHVYDQDGDPVDSASTYFLSQTSDDSDRQRTDVRLFDYLPMKMQPGEYRVELSAIDDVSKLSGSTSLILTVPDYALAGLTMSDLELAYEIRDVGNDTTAGINPRLVKNGLLVVPNPSATFHYQVDSLLHIYYELYGLDAAPQQKSKFTIQYAVKDASGNLIHDYGKSALDKPGGSAVLTANLDISSIAPGSYYLVVEAEDSATGARAAASKQFAIYDPNAASARLDSADVQNMVDIAWFHLSEADKIRIGKLSPEGKVNLLRQFWRNQDPDPSNPENPVYEEAVRRFMYANEKFSTTQKRKDGWRTDRGRVYIMYGPYDERNEVVMSGKSFPYIKWTYYHLEGGCIFLFVNDFVAGAADYRLVHSTHPRERYDPKWQAVLEDEDKSDKDYLNIQDQY
jgi:GWxTD domain-containing protein